MNTPVSFEIKQLLYYRGWRYEIGIDETGYRVEHSLAEQRWNEGDLTYVDITIAEIVMWLYEKHGIWIEVRKSYLSDFVPVIKGPRVELDTCKSPTEAYEAGIEYTLNNLI